MKLATAWWWMGSLQFPVACRPPSGWLAATAAPGTTTLQLHLVTFGHPTPQPQGDQRVHARAVLIIGRPADMMNEGKRGSFIGSSIVLCLSRSGRHLLLASTASAANYSVEQWIVSVISCWSIWDSVPGVFSHIELACSGTEDKYNLPAISSPAES